MFGIPMRPEQIEDLMGALNVSKIAHTDPEGGDQGGGAPGGAGSDLESMVFSRSGTQGSEREKPINSRSDPAEE